MAAGRCSGGGMGGEIRGLRRVGNGGCPRWWLFGVGGMVLVGGW